MGGSVWGGNKWIWGGGKWICGCGFYWYVGEELFLGDLLYFLFIFIVLIFIICCGVCICICCWGECWIGFGFIIDVLFNLIFFWLLLLLLLLSILFLFNLW